ncbi:unnamed protein product, partial [Adineta ricciae]
SVGGYIVADSPLRPMISTFQTVHLWIYDLIPSGLILSFNFLSIHHLHKLRRTTTITNSKIRHQPITITLIISGFTFVMTRTPASLNYGFLYPTLSKTYWGRYIIDAFNLLLYTCPVLSFPIYFMTFSEFRHQLINFVTRRPVTTRIAGDAPVQVVQVRGQNK